MLETCLIKCLKEMLSPGTRCFSACAKSGSIENLRVLFDQMPFCDSVSYNIVIVGLARSGFSSKALEVFVRMNSKGFEPSEYTHMSVLNACSIGVNCFLLLLVKVVSSVNVSCSVNASCASLLVLLMPAVQGC
ncbi:hypothetical protein REPUB_Repub03eG0076900 [Reevesia pubescens]